ncbi:MAG TPA: hypothetical protein PLY87_08970 [Planctomycetaceae bacterium]|nr:hypothetical protein [Planctomycetaceae bacterium]
MKMESVTETDEFFYGDNIEVIDDDFAGDDIDDQFDGDEIAESNDALDRMQANPVSLTEALKTEFMSSQSTRLTTARLKNNSIRAEIEPVPVEESQEPDVDSNAVQEDTDDASRTRALAASVGPRTGMAYLSGVVRMCSPALSDGDVILQHLIDLMQRAGTDGDPLREIMMQQIAIAHHRVAQLHHSAAESKTPEAVLAFTMCATKLMAELRKSMLAFRELQQIPMDSRFLRQPKSPVEGDS